MAGVGFNFTVNYPVNLIRLSCVMTKMSAIIKSADVLCPYFRRYSILIRKTSELTRHWSPHSTPGSTWKSPRTSCSARPTNPMSSSRSSRRAKWVQCPAARPRANAQRSVTCTVCRVAGAGVRERRRQGAADGEQCHRLLWWVFVWYIFQLIRR